MLILCSVKVFIATKKSGKPTKLHRKRDEFILTKRAVLLILSALCVVLSINTINTLANNLKVTIEAAGSDGWNNDSFTVRPGERLNLRVPTKFDHTFAGWYRDQQFTRPFNPETDTIRRDTVLYARFERNFYTITLIDPSLYLRSDGSLNPNYTPQTFTQPVGTYFTFPAAPRTPAPSEGLGAFKGWSLSMHYKQPDNNSKTNIIATPGQTYQNFFRQNATYWAAWEDWKLPISTAPSTQRVHVDFLVSFPSEAQFLEIPQELTIPVGNPKNGHPLHLPITLPTMFLTVLNNGFTSYSFGGWALVENPTPSYRIYRDGEAVLLETVKDYFHFTEVETEDDCADLCSGVRFFAVWVRA